MNATRRTPQPPITRALARGRCSWIYDDGGRKAAGFKGDAGDCVIRAVAIATGRPYREIYDELSELCRQYKPKKGQKKQASARNGVYRDVWQPYIESLGFVWVPTMKIGQGCTVHLRADELPGGTIIARVSKHMVTVIGGRVYDTHDPTRDGTRCVYGYFYRPTEKALD